MFNKLLEFFQGDESDVGVDVDSDGNPTPHDLHVATVVILMEMAGSDNDIDVTEAETLCNSIATEFGIPEEEIPELVQIAISARAESGKIDQFVTLINKHFNEDQRTQILSMIWQVVLADGKIDRFEERFAVQMKTRFKLSEEDLAEAKIMAEEKRAL